MLIQGNINYTMVGEPSQMPKGIIIFFKAGSSIRSAFYSGLFIRLGMAISVSNDHLLLFSR